MPPSPACSTTKILSAPTPAPRWKRCSNAATTLPVPLHRAWSARACTRWPCSQWTSGIPIMPAQPTPSSASLAAEGTRSSSATPAATGRRRCARYKPWRRSRWTASFWSARFLTPSVRGQRWRIFCAKCPSSLPTARWLCRTPIRSWSMTAGASRWP